MDGLTLTLTLTLTLALALALTLTLTLTRYTLADGGVVRAWLYLWHGHSRAVVFDVDGTITLNDGLGHVGNVLDQSFTHPGQG